jgi:hypothetical protein
MGDYMSHTIWKYFDTFGSDKKEKMSWDEKKTIIRVWRQNYINKKRLLNKMDKFAKWVRNKFRNATPKEIMMDNNNGALQELTEEKWNEHVSRLANLAMALWEREDLDKQVDFRFNWSGNNEIREDEKKFKAQYMPVKRNIACNFKDPHRANSQACSTDEFNFVASHLRMGNTYSYNNDAIKSLMFVDHARKLVEEAKHQKAAAVMSQIKRSSTQQYERSRNHERNNASWVQGNDSEFGRKIHSQSQVSYLSTLRL